MREKLTDYNENSCFLCKLDSWGGGGRKGGESIYGVSYANCYAKIRTVYLMEFIQQTLWSMQISKWNVMKEKDSKEELINKTVGRTRLMSQSNDN